MGRPKGSQVGVSPYGANEADKFRARMAAEAQAIFEHVLHRQRWTVIDRDRLAERLGRLVDREIERKS